MDCSLAKALDDALYQNDLREAQIAIAWVQGRSRNFKFVCHLAGTIGICL